MQLDIRELIEQKNFVVLKEAIQDLPSADIAEILEELEEDDEAVVFRILPRERAAEVFEYLPIEYQERLLQLLSKESVEEILNEMSPDDRTMLLEELPGEVTQRLLKVLSPEQRRIASTLLGYPEESVGRLMTPEYVAVRSYWTLQETLDFLRKTGEDRETLNVIYVVDERGYLIDDIKLRQVVLGKPESTIADLMDNSYVSLSATEDREVAVQTFKKYDRVALPVVDSEGKLLGIVTVDDMLDVAEEEATEDIQKMGGMAALDEPYLEIPLVSMIRKRAGWLVVLFLGEMLTTAAMGHFEEEIARAVVLALFIPLIISSGGNSGGQAATLVIRALALGEITLKSWWKIMRREVYSGLWLGGILGVIGYVRIVGWSLFSDVYGPHAQLIGITVALALVFVVLCGTLSGSMFPLILRRLGADPAVSSAPFVATLVDVMGVIIYFTLASFILRGTLL